MQKILRSPVIRQAPDLRIGVEIGHSAVKLAAVRRTEAGPSLAAFLVEPIPRGSVVDGIVRDTAVVVRALERLRVAAHLPRTEVVTALPDTAVQFKVMRVDRSLDARQVLNLAQREARALIRDPSIPITVDIAVLGESVVGDQVQDLLLVAAKAVDVQRHADLFRKAGWIPSVLEVDSLVIRHGVAHPSTHYESGAPITALFDLGAGGIHLSVMRGEHTLFHRAATWAAPVFDLTTGQIVAEPFLDCVRSLMQAFHRHTGVEHLDRLQVTGGLSLDPTWVAELADWIGLPAETWKPSWVVSIPPSWEPPEQDRMLSQAFVPVSLALRGFE